MSIRRAHLHWLLPFMLLLEPLRSAASPVCDPSIRQNPDDPQGYQEREGQICEGVYATEVASLGLIIASFTAPMQAIDMTRHSRLRLQWTPVGPGEVRVRADSLRPRFYYRMDAVRPASETQLTWANSIPAQNHLRTNELGLLATQQDPSGQSVYLPLDISQDGQVTPGGPYVVSVISGAELEEVYWSLAAQDGNFIVYDEPLNRKPYPANQPIAIELDQVVEPGTYQLTVSAELSSGAYDTVELTFRHSP